MSEENKIAETKTLNTMEKQYYETLTLTTKSIN